MILSSPARGHVIIHQARASNRNFMRLPWQQHDVIAIRKNFAVIAPARDLPEPAAYLARLHLYAHRCLRSPW
jgi:hypothetical protein